MSLPSIVCMRDFIPTSIGTYVMLPQLFEKCWLYNLYCICNGKLDDAITLSKNTFLSNIAHVWEANIEDMHTYREWNSVITDCTLKPIDTQEHFVDCFEACSVTASFDYFYACAKVGKWTICIWDENKCVQMFKEGPRD